MLYLKGGVASGFKSVEPETYSPRLLHMSGKGTNVRVREVDLDAAFLNSTDVFILDKGYVASLHPISSRTISRAPFISFATTSTNIVFGDICAD